MHDFAASLKGWHSLFLNAFQSLGDQLYFGQKAWEIFSGCPPDYFGIHIEISVNDSITHSNYVCPWDLGVGLA